MFGRRLVLGRLLRCALNRLDVRVLVLNRASVVMIVSVRVRLSLRLIVFAKVRRLLIVRVRLLMLTVCLLKLLAPSEMKRLVSSLVRLSLVITC